MTTLSEKAQALQPIRLMSSTVTLPASPRSCRRDSGESRWRRASWRHRLLRGSTQAARPGFFPAFFYYFSFQFLVLEPATRQGVFLAFVQHQDHFQSFISIIVLIDHPAKYTTLGDKERRGYSSQKFLRTAFHIHNFSDWPSSKIYHFKMVSFPITSERWITYCLFRAIMSLFLSFVFSRHLFSSYLLHWSDTFTYHS